ncbi:MAG: carboxylating nicotinate-nucleotide diphosphorylase [Magnetococcales bacterium]|nr:carboxylating nicotinate-nucleotide diphosphorylase [Magnetococcales bacterium]MBF0150932.1 carboxylating nicotinate-nucleotide diphosphorylase [Magnetococcales bacterium]MBF0174185.1 carboxylating nicotinate-nucleotide diphosphorylase [Magnetococcales bacterium]MBF0349116.1 carboxylating nicotinate-nucleotide diphosphorylase [Magnetococcales bacterium]MBF0631977.1 carboxylating nicotinate-nucleotide diphosphorylase [Magnetococcales bacterium]
MNPPWLDIVTIALNQDLGRGDITTNALVSPGQKAEAELVAKEDMVVCGLPVVAEVFRAVDSRIRMLPERPDGEGVLAGNRICTIHGPARGILAGERVALNFFQNLSAVATLTRQYVEQVEGTRARICDTRKTTPGLRLLQKYAVRIGGGYNHRFGLDDGVLIKENHIALAGGIALALKKAYGAVSHLHGVEIEVETLDQLREALDAGARIILLDNMSLENLEKAVAIAGGKALLEASGNVTLSNVRAVAETGVDLISVGAITHSAGSKDVSLLVTM